MTLLDLIRAFHRAQATLARRVMERVAEIWADLDGRDLDGSWRAANVADRLLVAVAQSQSVAVTMSDRYVALALLGQGGVADPAGVLDPSSLVGIASDGRDLDDLLARPLVGAKVAIRDGVSPTVALARARAALGVIAGTQVADAGRVAAGTATAAQTAASGWMRVLTLPSCDRCAVLAGRVYRWSEGFERHPMCDCVHAPVGEASDAVDGLRVDPGAYFASLSPPDQDKYFTRAGAEAIRLGADIGQVVNARRGGSGSQVAGRLTGPEQALLRRGRAVVRTDVYGRRLAVTTEGTTVRGVAGRLSAREDGAERVPGVRVRSARVPRLMPEAILELAGDDRVEAVRLLGRFGYLRT